MKMSQSPILKRLRDVGELILAHPQVCSDTIQFTEDSKGHIAHFEIAIHLPRDSIDGVSSTGTREVELVGLRFKDTFPFSAPTIELRPDFNRQHPHINPSAPDTPVKPCISEEPLKELLNDPDWIQTIISRLADWLSDSATNQLMELQQGWEPIRRDELLGSVIIDSESLTNLARNKGGAGACYFEYQYLYDDVIGHAGVLQNPNKSYDRIIKVPGQNDLATVGGIDFKIYGSCALLIWPDKELVVDSYLPDTVTTFEELAAAAKNYGCDLALRERMKELESHLRYKDKKGRREKESVKVRLLVIVPVQRPVNIIGKSSPYELIPYVLTIPVDQSFNFVLCESEAAPIAHVEAVNNKLLRELSGRDTAQPDCIQHVTVVGCGSVGSKICLHLARAGVSSFDLIDNSLFRPHNNARHALTDEGFQYKVSLMRQAVERLGAKVRTCRIRDATQIPPDQWSKLAQRSKLIIDATASSSVREFLGNLSWPTGTAKIIRCELYNRGNLSVTQIEGCGDSPRLEDLAARFYQKAFDKSDIGKHVYRSKAMKEVRVGDSCSSFTMTMNDATISAHAADMANVMLQLLDDPHSHSGEVLIGKHAENGLGITYESFAVPAAITCEVSIRETTWQVRVPEDIVAEMQTLSSEYAPNEYGGVLIGQVLWARRKLMVTSILPFLLTVNSVVPSSL